MATKPKQITAEATVRGVSVISVNKTTEKRIKVELQLPLRDQLLVGLARHQGAAVQVSFQAVQGDFLEDPPEPDSPEPRSSKAPRGGSRRGNLSAVPPPGSQA